MLIEKIEKYYKEHEGKSLYFYPLAVLYLQNKEKEKAYQILLDGIKYYPRYTLALIKIAKILMDEKKYKAALAYLETVIQIQKNNEIALRDLAFVYEQLKDYERALGIYEKLIELEPNNEKIKSKIVEIAPLIKPKADKLEDLMDELQGENTAKQKKETLEDVLKIEDEDNVSVVGESVGEDIDVNNIPKLDLDSEEELTIEENAVESEEKDNQEQDEEEATVTLASLYENQGYIKDAIKTYKRVLEKEPDNAEAIESLKRLENMENNK